MDENGPEEQNEPAKPPSWEELEDLSDSEHKAMKDIEALLEGEISTQKYHHTAQSALFRSNTVQIPIPSCISLLD